MRVLVVRHHDIDEAGFIEAAFVARGAEITVHLVPDDGPLPPLDGVDHIVLLGAVWSVYDEATIGHWIGAELDWLREADRAGVPVLGICFGAQALSAAMGGQVVPVGFTEVGWTMVESLDPDIIEPGPWMEFHNDRCLPPAHAPAAGPQRRLRPGLQRRPAPGRPVPPRGRRRAAQALAGFPRRGRWPRKPARTRTS